MFRGRLRNSFPLDLTASDMLRSGAAAGEADLRARQEGEARDRAQLAREIGQVADYVAGLKREIAALKPAEIHHDRIPSALSDLNGAKAATSSAAEKIMVAAEAVLARDSSEPDYESFVQERVMEIMEACSFQDISGQHLSRAIGSLERVQKRVQRFSKAVKVADATELFDREAIIRKARKEILLIEGPQNRDAAIDQAAVDKLFD
jgi:chemotaxis protein CheZ